MKLRTKIPWNRSAASSTAFTLIELLAVIAIIAVLATLLMPMLSKMRDRADTAKCSSNLRKIGVAHTQFIAEHDNSLIPAAFNNDEGRTWYNLLEPYVGIDPEADFRSPNRPGWQYCPSKRIKDADKS